MASSSSHPPTPASLQKVLAEYFGKQTVAIAPIYDGHTNLTYLVSADTTRFILQRLSPHHSAQFGLDTDITLRHLLSEGWEVQALVVTKRQQPAVLDHDGYRWRLLTYVAAEPFGERRLGIQASRAAGTLLANLHRSLRKLAYTPAATIPHFHETAYHARQLRERLPRLPAPELRALAADILLAHEELPPLPPHGPQLIHGDPRPTNMLFRDGRPFTFIDFDTVLQGTIWLDIGDLLRAVNCNEAQTEVRFSLERTRHIVEGYRLATNEAATPEVFLQWSLTAMQYICLELAMRLMVDIVDDSSFGWNSEIYASRAANNLARARAQWLIYQYADRHTPQLESGKPLAVGTQRAAPGQ